MKNTKLVSIQFIVPDSRVEDFIADVEEHLRFADLPLHHKAGVEVRGVPAKVATRLPSKARFDLEDLA